MVILCVVTTPFEEVLISSPPNPESFVSVHKVKEADVCLSVTHYF